MVGTLVQGPREKRAANGGVHILGSTVGGAATGLILAWLAGLPRLGMDTRLSLVAGLAIAYGAMEAGMIRLPLPQSGAQVPATWRYRFPKPVTAGLYGGVLGTGIGTRVSSAAFVGVLGAATLLGSPVAGAVVMGSYGLGRASAVVLASARASRECGGAMLFGYRWAPLWRAMGVLQMSVLAGATLGVLMSR